MKKLLVVLTVVLMLVSVFAVEKPFTLGPVSYTGTVNFTLLLTKDGVDISGALLDVNASLAYGPTSDTQAGATFDISYTFPGGASLSLRTITFTTPYFGALYSTGKMFVSDYFTGKDYDATGTPFKDPFKSDFEDSLKLTFPAVAGLEVYYLDKNSERTDSWFSDMLLAKYTLAGWTIVGGTYETELATDTHEFGAAFNGSLPLGFITPSVQAFTGMVEAATKMVLAYDLKVSATYSPADFLTLTPEFKWSENINKLDYKSSNISDGRYIKSGVTFQRTFENVTLKAVFTPKYDFTVKESKIPLSEFSVKAVINPVTLYAKMTNVNLLTANPYDLDAKADITTKEFSLVASAYWLDAAKLDKFSYVHLYATANEDPLTIEGNLRFVPDSSGVKNGYNLIVTYVITNNVKFSAFYGTLTKDSNGEYTVINTDPTWNAKLTYTASF